MAFCRASSLFYPPRVRHFTHRGSLWTASCRSRLPFLFAGVSSVVVIYFLLPNSSPSLPTLTAKALSPSYFVPATLVGSIQTSPDTKLLTLSLSPEVVPQNSTPIWSVCIKDDDIQVERHYTPLEGIDKNGNMLFWIKKYQHGEVSRWLHSKQPGSRIEVRGPLQTWSWKDGIWEEIIMVNTSCSGDNGLYREVRRFLVVLGSLRSTSSCIAYSLQTRACLTLDSRCSMHQRHLPTCPLP